MLRPYVFSVDSLEPFGNTEPNQPVLLWPVEWMHDVHLTDRIAEQVEPERDAGAANQFARPAEDLGFGAVRPRDAGVIEDARLDRQGAVVTAPDAEQAEGRETQLNVADQDLAADELIEDRAGRAVAVAALAGAEAADVVTAHQTRVPDEERVHAVVLRVPAVAADVEHASGDGKGPCGHDVFAVVRQRRDESQSAEGRVCFDSPARAEDRAGRRVARVI